jgi:acyl carrier protein
MSESNQDSITQEIISFVQENILDASVSFDAETIFKDIGVDSFSVIQIVLFIERKYGVKMTEADLTAQNLASVKSLTSFTISKL